MKYQEVTGGVSGLVLLVLLVALGLQGLNQPITLGNIILGLMAIAAILTLIGGGIFAVLLVYFSLLKRENQVNQSTDSTH